MAADGKRMLPVELIGDIIWQSSEWCSEPSKQAESLELGLGGLVLIDAADQFLRVGEEVHGKKRLGQVVGRRLAF